VPWETFLPGITLRWLIGFKGANSALPLLALYTINDNSVRPYLRDHGDTPVPRTLGKLDVTAVRAAVAQALTQRATHNFPPLIRIPAEWKPEIEVLEKELGYPTTSAVEIEARFRTFVDALASGV